MKIKENLWGINERAMKINEKLMRSMKIRCKFNLTQWNSMEITENQLKSMKINGKSKKNH